MKRILLALGAWLLLSGGAGAQNCPNGICLPPGDPFPPSPVIQAPAGQSAAVPDAVRHAEGAVVMISNRGFAGGSGVYLGEGLVMTCDHLFRNGMSGRRDVGRVTVSFQDGTASEATLLGQDPTWDLALMRLEHPPKHIPAAKWATAIPQSGDTVVSCGFGTRGRIASNVGTVLSYGQDKFRRAAAADTMILSGSARSGDSGGPIFNRQGRLTGILWGTDGRTVVGTQVGRCWLFGRPWFRRRPPPSCEPQQDAPLFPPRVEGPPASERPPDEPPQLFDKPKDDVSGSELAALRQEIDDLRRQIREIKRKTDTPGPPGPPGPQGPPGRNGQDAAADVQKLAEAVKKQIAGSIRVRVEPIRK